MFTGIIEHSGIVRQITQSGDNLIITLSSPFTQELKIDQSVSHDGVCLTVVAINQDEYQVVAIQETLEKTNLQEWMQGTEVNLERAMLSGSRLDGHMVQGHVDCIATCTEIVDCNGSWNFTFRVENKEFLNLLVPKGSVCINGISLTVVHCTENVFSVAIIPYTFEHTNLSKLKPGNTVNIEFDILGKYIQRQLAPYLSKLKS